MSKAEGGKGYDETKEGQIEINNKTTMKGERKRTVNVKVQTKKASEEG